MLTRNSEKLFEIINELQKLKAKQNAERLHQLRLEWKMLKDSGNLPVDMKFIEYLERIQE